MHIIHFDRPHWQKIAQALTLDVVFNAIVIAVIIALLVMIQLRL